ncbi:MAG: hypothetical protein AAGM38_00905 [Pseudomonadota bacterium]
MGDLTTEISTKATSRAAALALGLAAALGAAPAAADICNLQVFDAMNGRKLGKADKLFIKEEQFVVCVTATKAGYVSLWDRIPFDGPVERLGPSPLFEEDKARKVAADETVCFGDGQPAPNGARYLLNMAAEDGVGLGRMWMVYSEAIEIHPDENTFASADLFERNMTRAFGAGAMEPDPGDAARAEDFETDEGACVAEGSLDFFYRVERKPGQG